MTGWLSDMSKLEEEEWRKKITDVYVKQGFPPDFRSSMNNMLMNLSKWHTMTPSNRQIAFGTVWKNYRNSPGSSAEFTNNVPEKNTQLFQRFDQCINAELSLKIKPKKSVTKSSSRPSRVASSQSVITVASAVGATGIGSQVGSTVIPSSASSVTMKSTNSLEAQSIADIVISVKNLTENMRGMEQNTFYSEIEKAFKLLKSTFSHLSTAISCWKRQQQYLANQMKEEETQIENEEVDTISDFSELQTISENAQSVSDMLYRLLDIASDCIRSGWEKFSALRDEIAWSIVDLARTCFIVSRQPDQVLKKDNKFSVTISLLAGWHSKAPHRAVSIKAGVYTEEELKSKSLAASDWQLSSSKININTSSASFPQLESAFNCESEPATVPKKSGAATKRRATEKKKDSFKSFVASNLPVAYHAVFSNVSWSKAEQERRNATNVPCVTDLKYALVFEVEWSIVGKNNYVQKAILRCMSLPITCVVHVNQELRARGTIFWDNAFAAYQGQGSCECRRRLPPGILQWKASDSISGFATSNTNGFSLDQNNFNFSCSASSFSQVTLMSSVALPTSSSALSNFSSESCSLFGDGSDGGGHHYCRQPFVTPEIVGWSVFKRELNRWFESQTKCKLSDEHLKFVERCVVQQKESPSLQPGGLHQAPSSLLASVTTSGVEFSSPLATFEPRVARSRVLTDLISEPIQSSSFWSWLYGLKKLIVDGGDPLVSFLWREGLIHFITHEEAIKKLSEQPNDVVADTMLIRFCNSERTRNPNQATTNRGAVVITQGYHQKEHSGGSSVAVRSLEPWNSEILRKMDLERRLASDKLVRGTVYPKEQGSWEKVLQKYHSMDPERALHPKNVAPTDTSVGNTEYVPTENECVPNDPSEDALARQRMRRPTSDTSTDEASTPFSRRLSTTYDSSSPSPSSHSDASTAFSQRPVQPMQTQFYQAHIAQPIPEQYYNITSIPQGIPDPTTQSNLAERLDEIDRYIKNQFYNDDLGTSLDGFAADFGSTSLAPYPPTYAEDAPMHRTLLEEPQTTLLSAVNDLQLYNFADGQDFQNVNSFSLNINQLNGVQ